MVSVIVDVADACFYSNWFITLISLDLDGTMSNDCSGDEELARRLQMEENYRGLLLRNRMSSSRGYARAPSRLRSNKVAGDSPPGSTPDVALGHVGRAIRDGAEWMLGLPSMILRNLRMYPMEDFDSEATETSVRANQSCSSARSRDQELARRLQEQEFDLMQPRRQSDAWHERERAARVSRTSAREPITETPRPGRVAHSSSNAGNETPARLLDRSILHRLLNDEMTYEDMLDLQEALGSVSRGASQGQISMLPSERFEPRKGKVSVEESAEVRRSCGCAARSVKLACCTSLNAAQISQHLCGPLASHKQNVPDM
eukprot:752331-Hanusia_phi.AAC.4